METDIKKLTALKDKKLKMQNICGSSKNAKKQRACTDFMVVLSEETKTNYKNIKKKGSAVGSP